LHSQSVNTYLRDWRILTPADYQQVFNSAKAIKTSTLTILYKPNTLGHPRIGMAVSNKHSKNVVNRNRVKRVIREYFRQNLREIGNLDLVVLSKPGMAKCIGTA